MHNFAVCGYDNASYMSYQCITEKALLKNNYIFSSGQTVTIECSTSSSRIPPTPTPILPPPVWSPANLSPTTQFSQDTRWQPTPAHVASQGRVTRSENVLPA